MEALAARGNVAEALRVFDGAADAAARRARHEPVAGGDRRPRAAAAAAGARRREPARSPQSGRGRCGDPAAGRAAPPRPGPADRPRAASSARARRSWLGGSVASGPGALAAQPVVLLAGDAGIGKTRLTAELARRVHDAGAIVLAGRSPRETVVPYQPFLEALRHWALNAPAERPARDRARVRVRAGAADPGAAPARPRAAAAARRTSPRPSATGCSRRSSGCSPSSRASAPVLLVLDDLQWADRPTLLLLRHLARATQPGPAADPGRLPLDRAARRHVHERAGRAAPRPARLPARHRRPQRVGDRRAGAAASRRDARRARSPARCTRRPRATRSSSRRSSATCSRRACRRAARARPSSSASGCPRGSSRCIAWRLGRLEAPAIELLRVAAVIGRDFDAALLERVVLLAEEEFLSALDEALAAGLLVESDERPGSYMFSHALIRETLYEGMSAPRRARIHRRVGEAIEATQGRRLERYLPELAHHFTRGGRSPRTPRRRSPTPSAPASRRPRCSPTRRRPSTTPARSRCRGASSPRRSARRCELLLALGEARVRAGERRPGLLGVPRGGRAGRAARRRRRAGPGGDRGLPPLRPAAGRGRHGADRDDRAGARARAGPDR